MSENPPFYEDLTLTTSDYGGAGRVLEEKEVGKHIAIGANILEGDPGVRNVISVPPAQRAIKVSFQEAMIRKDFANVPLRKSASEKAGDTASFLLAKEIYEHCSKKPHLVSSSIQQGSRELNIKKKG